MRIVVLHAGGIGDVVLAESYLAALREQHPGARVELVCRTDVAPLTGLYGQPPDAVHTFHFNPYRWAIPNDRAALQARTLIVKLAGAAVDLFVSAELRATWLSDVLAAALAPGEAVIADDRIPSPSDVLILLGRLRLQRNRAVRHLIAVNGEHELDRYARLAGASERRLPALRRPPGTAPSGELVVFPLGSNRTNRWPPAAMGEAARRVSAAYRAPIVLVGSHADRPELEAAVAGGNYGDGAEIVTGAPHDLPLVAARIASATGFVGIETGLVHVAAAYGVPGATVYGGGYWPVYAPWSPRSAAVVAPIPCFGCAWDCAFDRPFCIEGVDVDSVAAAFDDAYHDESGGGLVRSLDAYGGRERAIFATAAAVHRTTQDDRAARLTAITRLRHLMSRYIRRTRARSRKTSLRLGSLADTLNRAAAHLDDARSGVRGTSRTQPEQ